MKTIAMLSNIWICIVYIWLLQLEQVYQSKNDALLQRERNSIERMQREQEVCINILV